MAKATGKRKIEQYQHEDKKRANNPPVGLVTPAIDELTPERTGMTFIKAQMNPDLLTDDLKKKRSSNDSWSANPMWPCA